MKPFSKNSRILGKPNTTPTGHLLRVAVTLPAQNLTKLTVEGLEISKNFTEPRSRLSKHKYTHMQARPGDQFIDYESSVFTFASCTHRPVYSACEQRRRKGKQPNLAPTPTTTNAPMTPIPPQTIVPSTSTILTFSMKRCHHQLCCLLSSLDLIHVPRCNTLHPIHCTCSGFTQNAPSRP